MKGALKSNVIVEDRVSGHVDLETQHAKHEDTFRHCDLPSVKHPLIDIS